VVTINVTPVLPWVNLSPLTQTVDYGGDGTINWQITTRTLGLILEVNGVPEILPTELISGPQRAIPFEKLTRTTNTVRLIAQNEFSTTRPTHPVTITVRPRINRFTQSATKVIQGSKFQLSWEVSSREPVSLQLPSNERTPIGFSEARDFTASETVTGPQRYVLVAYDPSGDINDPAAVTSSLVITIVPRANPFVQNICDVFIITPLTVSLGTADAANVKLSWLGYSTDAQYTDRIEINGPNVNAVFEEKLNQASSRSLTLSPQQVGTFPYIIKITRLDESANPPVLFCNKLLAVGPPLPRIDRFVAIDTSGVDLPPKSADATSIRYVVNVSQTIRLRWETTNAAGTKLKAGSTQFDLAKSGDSQDFVISSNQNQFTLTPVNGDLAGQPRSVFFDVQASVPAPVQDLLGQPQADGTILLSWQDFNTGSVIVGYRIRQAIQGTSNYIVLNPNSQGFVGPANGRFSFTIPSTCGYSYYVVVVYKNAANLDTEGPPSTRSFDTAPCALPTATPDAAQVVPNPGSAAAPEVGPTLTPIP
jgi:hypothetical protein